MKKLILFLIGLVFLSGCEPSDEDLKENPGFILRVTKKYGKCLSYNGYKCEDGEGTAELHIYRIQYPEKTQEYKSASNLNVYDGDSVRIIFGRWMSQSSGDNKDEEILDVQPVGLHYH